MFLAQECRHDLVRHSRGACDFFLAFKIALDSLARGSDVGLRARSSCALRARRTSSRATNPAADETWLAVLRVRRRPGP